MFQIELLSGGVSVLCRGEKGERLSAEDLRDRVNDGPCKRYERMEGKKDG